MEGVSPQGLKPVSLENTGLNHLLEAEHKRLGLTPPVRLRVLPEPNKGLYSCQPQKGVKGVM